MCLVNAAAIPSGSLCAPPNGSFTIPSEVRYFDTVYFGNTYLELSKNNKEFHLSKSEATEEYPIGLKQSNTIKVLPTTIEEVTISFLRNPIKAKWTYMTIDGVEIYNPDKSDFKDIDIHSSEESDLILRVLQSFGINLKEQDLQRITEQMKQGEFNKEITT